MTADLELFRKDEAGNLLSLVGKVERTTGAYQLRALVVSFKSRSVGSIVSTDLALNHEADVAVDIPDILIVDDGGALRFRTASEIEDLARHEFEALEKQRRRLRQRLAEPIVLSRDATVLGLNGLAEASLRLSPLLIDLPDPAFRDDTVLIAVQARATIEGKIGFDQTIGGTKVEASVDIDGHLSFELAITYGDLKDLDLATPAWLRLDVPSFPGFDFDFPRIALPKLPGLSFDGLELLPNLPKWPRLVPFDLPMLDAGLFQDLPIKAEWDTEPTFTISNSSGTPQIVASKGDLTFTYGTPMDPDLTLKLSFDELTFSKDGTDGDITYTAESRDIPVPQPDPFEVMGLKVQIGKSVLQLKLEDRSGVPHAVVLHLITGAEGAGIVLSDASNPDIALHVDLVMSYAVPLTGTGKVSSKVESFAVREPYPVKLVEKAVEQIGEWLSYVGQIKIPKPNHPDLPELEGLKEVLRRVAELVRAAAAWLARQAGAAGNAIAGAAEALAEVVKEVFEKISEVNPDGNSFPALAFELRLDPKTYLPVQVVVMPAGVAPNLTYETEVLGIHLSLDAGFRPALVFDRTGADWFGLCVFPDQTSSLTLGTDLWLDRDDGPDRSLGTIEDEYPPAERAPHLIGLKATAINQTGTPKALVLAALQRGKLRLFKTFSGGDGKELQLPGDAGDNLALTVGSPGQLQDAGVVFGAGTPLAGDVLRVEERIDAAELKKRALALMPKSEGESGAVGKLVQRIKITDVQHSLDGKDLKLALTVKVELEQDFDPSTKLELTVSLDDLSSKISGGTEIIINAEAEQHYSPLGLDLSIKPKDQPAFQANGFWPAFRLNLARGAEQFEMTDQTLATLTYKRVSTSGRGLVFQLNTFGASRGGFDLDAEILPEPVELGGIKMPFRFTSGQISIKGSKFNSAGLAGKGQLPPALIGEANASIAMQLGRGQDGNVAVLGATAQLDKSGDPIRCHGTMFELTITNLGFDFVNDGAYHFYFLLTGSAVFKPSGGAFSEGLLKNIRNVEIKLDKAPLGGDSATLLRSLSFLVKVDPPSRTNVFDIFTFDLRGIAFYPASDKFDGDPAMGISGKVNFSDFGDLPTPRFDFHEMGIAAPKEGSVLPRVKFEGLTVGLKMGAVDLEGTAFAVDDRLPSLVQPPRGSLDLQANGFLASAKISMPGWASMSGAVGYLELDRRDGPSDKRHAFFVYGQVNKQSVPIATPLGTIYLREYGLGIGRRYTLAGIAQAETARSPGELIRILDEVSKYQGSLDKFEAWTPTYDNSDITLALRGMFSIAAAKPNSPYDEKAEKELPNPLLFDIVAAFRTDFTFMINLRAWLTTNYNDWVDTSAPDAFKTNPTLRGYMYFSVPRKEFLARMVSDRGGHVGKRPELPEPLVKAIQAVQFSSTLYVRPGLFHMEFGWPYELGFDLGRRSDSFSLRLRGGLINRIEDFSLLYGMAFRADGHVRFGGSINLGFVGASARAEAVFALQAKILSYISLRRPMDSIYYGMLRFDLNLAIRVEAWIRIPLVVKTITLRIGFSITIAVSIGLEAVISLRGLGGQAHVTVGVRAFGKTLSLGLRLSFNNGLLNRARAQVARFEALGLAADLPPASEDGQRSERVPRPNVPRGETIQIGDGRIDDDLGKMPIPQPAPDPAAPPPDYVQYEGVDIAATDFWALLFPIASKPASYVMQLVPRDTSDPNDTRQRINERSGFYVSPTIGEVGNIATFSASHTLMSSDEELLKALVALSAKDGSEQPPIVGPAVSQFEKEIALSLDEEVTQSNEGAPLYLGELLQTMFLNKIDSGTVKLTEPTPRFYEEERIELPEDRQAAADELGRIGRTRAHLTGQEKLEAEIEEQRSAVISEIVDGADWLARNMVAGSVPGRRAPLDPRDFGLTFEVTEDDLRKLFDLDMAETEAPAGNFTVKKSDAAEKGEVHLFNPPSRMFRDAQPRLQPVLLGTDADNRLVEPDQGLKLDWDLEPAWGASRSFYDDPEQHLKHYKITRRIVGYPTGENFGATFTLKAATAEEFFDKRNEHGKLTARMVRQVRPPQQFVDDLRQADPGADGQARQIPKALRDVLLGLQTEPAATDRSDAARAFRSLSRNTDLRVEYQIVPVDIAGTAESARDGDFGALFIYRPPATRQPRPVAPQEATMQVIYPAMPSLVAADAEQPDQVSEGETGTPDLRLMLREAAPVAARPEDRPAPALTPPGFDGVAFDLRLWTTRSVPAGGYGADAVDEAKTRLGQEQIDALAIRGVAQDVRLTLSAHQPGQNVPPDAISVVIERHDSSTAETYDAVLSDADGRPVLASGLASLLGATSYRIGGDSISPTPGQVTHAFLRRRATEAAGEIKPSTWRSVSMNLAILGREHGLGATTPLPADTILENFEQPVAMAFRALSRADLHARSGRLHVYRPRARSTLAGFAGADIEAALDMAPDPRRRTATRLRWNARPRSLALAGTALGQTGPSAGDLYRMVAGFRIFSLNPDTFTGDATDQADLADAADTLADLRLLPVEQRGLSPDTFGDMARLEMAFPAEDWRDTSGAAAKAARGPGADTERPGQTPWFSLAESLPIFPQPRLRRLILSELEDGIVAELFQGGAPDVVQLDMTPEEGEWGSALDAWTLASDHPGANANGMTLTLDAGGADPFKVADLREALRWLRLVPKAAQTDTALDAEQAMLADRDLRATLSGARLRLEGFRFERDADNNRTGSAQSVTGKIFTPLELAPRLHPILADTLALVTLNKLDPRPGEPVFRQYALVTDAPAAPQAATLSEYLAEIPQKRDPHGFAAMRMLGLAEGFQLYDTDTGTFLRGEEALLRINEAYAEVLKVYRINSALPPAREGLPFADILTMPWGNGRLHWFDGGQEDIQEGDALRMRESDTLAAVQISLRPAPDRLRPMTVAQRVTYWSLRIRGDWLRDALDAGQMAERGRLDRFRIKWKEVLPRDYLLDLRAETYGIETLPQIRMSSGPDGADLPEDPTVQIGYTGPTGPFGEGQDAPGDHLLAYLRHARLSDEASGAFPDAGAFTVEAIFVRPDGTETVVDAVAFEFEKSDLKPEENGGIEPGMGVFKPYPDADWGQILWPPAGANPRRPVPEMQRLLHYATGRFESPYPDNLKPTVTGSDGDAARIGLAGAFSRFWLRFVEHTVVPETLTAPAPGADAADIYFSLGTLADPGSWQQAPDAQGRVSIVLPDDDQRGGRRAFAVRPTGRYDDWAHAARWRLVRDGDRGLYSEVDPAKAVAQDLHGALEPGAPLRQWVGVTLPRTEPLEKPVILSARRVELNEGLDGRGRFEIVVAHPSDMVLAAANRNNEALLGFEAISPELYRSFAHGTWMEWLTSLVRHSADHQPLAAFGSAVLATSDDTTNREALDRRSARSRLRDLQFQAADAWLGATAFSFAQLPYFFRTHIHVHFSAGNMVSERAHVTMDEGFAKLHMPYSEIEGYEHRDRSAPASWHVAAGGTALLFDLPLMRFVDAMAAEDAALWFGQAEWAFDGIKPVAHLPDPLIGYRLGIETLADTGNTGAQRATQAQSFDIEIMPKPPAERGPDDPPPDLDALGLPFVAKYSSGQLRLAGDLSQVEIGPTMHEPDGFDWRIRLAVAIDTPTAPVVLALKEDGAEMLQDMAAVLTADNAFVLTWRALWRFGDDGPPEDEETLRAAMIAALTAAGWEAPADHLKAALQEAVDAGTLAEFALDTEVLALFWDAVPGEVLAYFQTDALGRDQALLRMRRPPDADEIAAVRDALADPGGFEATMQDWLFGLGRRPAFTATRGALPPLSEIIPHAPPVQE